MDHRAEVMDLLRIRRNRITPEQAGIIVGGCRRVPGLRREEVASLTGNSVEYYSRMERGDLKGVSLDVLDSLARALQLNEAEIDHFADLAKAATPVPLRHRHYSGFLMRSWAYQSGCGDQRLDFVATNPLGRALYAPLFEDPDSQGNTARFTFLNPASHVFFPDWEDNANSIVATLRTYSGQNPNDKKRADLIDELMTRSDAFRHRWAKHDVRHHRSGVKRIHHPVASGSVQPVLDGIDLGVL